MADRLPYIDWLKVIGILLVVWGHWYPEICGMWIYSFHVPLFFMISGFLFRKESSYRIFIEKNVRSLVIPYFLLCLIAIIPSARMCIQHPEILGIKLLGIICGFHTLWNVSCNGAMWFVYSLIIIKILGQISGKWLNLALCLLSIIFAYLYNMESHGNNWSVVNSIVLYPFFVLGNIAKGSIKEASAWIRNHRLVSIAIALLVFLSDLLLVRYNGMVWVFMGAVGKNLALFYINALAMSFVVYVLSCCLTFRNRNMEVVSSGTIVILALHFILIGRMRPFIDRLHFNVYGMDIIEFCLSVLILLIFIPVIRFTPSLLLGGRKKPS